MKFQNGCNFLYMFVYLGNYFVDFCFSIHLQLTKERKTHRREKSQCILKIEHVTNTSIYLYVSKKNRVNRNVIESYVERQGVS